jgi:hypothetical protein
VNRRRRTAARSWEEKEGEGGCKNQIHHCCHHRYKGGREDFMITTPGRDDTHTKCLLCTHTWSCWTYNWMMMEKEWSWEEERIAARIDAMLMRMGIGMDMGMGNADAMMQSQYEEDRMMEEPSW